MKVKQIVRRSNKSSRVRLEDGREALIPTELIEADFEESDFIDYKGLVYKTLRKLPRKPKVLINVRDIDTFDVQKELTLLKSIVLKYRSRGYLKKSDEIDDVVSDIFLHFWERNYFLGFDPEKCNYLSYLSCGVRNFLIDKQRREKSVRKKMKKGGIRVVSLDTPIGDDGTSHLSDFIPDSTQNTEFATIEREIINMVKTEIKKWDERCDNVTYSQVFEALLGKRDMKDLIQETGVSESVIMNRIKKIKDYFVKHFMGHSVEGFSVC